MFYFFFFGGGVLKRIVVGNRGFVALQWVFQKAFGLGVSGLLCFWASGF